MNIVLYIIIIIVCLVILFMGLVSLGGLVIIGERQVGVIVKKFSGKNLPAGQLIALEGESGYQAQTLSPGWHFFYWPWQYNIIKVPVVVIPQGEIGLVVAADGKAIPPERLLGKVIDCDNFQDAVKFLSFGGEKGRQMGILTAGTYRINTALFTIITAHNCSQNGMSPDQLLVYSVHPDAVGIVTTKDGIPIDAGEIAGSIIAGHNNFQNGQTFIDNGGRRGLQEQVLLSGSWNLNPWFVEIQQVPMTTVPIGYVGVVISYVGKAHEDVSGAEFKHGDLVNVGHKGVWVDPLYPGKHPINTAVAKVELVPTTNIVLNWASRTESHNYDAKLSSITVRSKDGFSFNLDVSQIIHVGAPDAPRVISRVGSMQNLVDHVLQPIVGNYFRNAAQSYIVLDFLSARSERQIEASEHIRKALGTYDVQAIDTLIGDITPPADLMTTLTDRKLAEEQKKTYEVQEAAQVQRQQLVRETSIADIQNQVVGAEQGVRISELHANAQIKQATGEAESIRLKASGEADATRAIGMAKADAYQAGVKALGEKEYSALQMIQVIGERSVRIVPNVMVQSGDSTSGLLESLLGMMVQDKINAGQEDNPDKKPAKKQA